MGLITAIRQLWRQARSQARGFPVNARGSVLEVRSYLDRLVRSPHIGTLVMQVIDAEPFVQFTGGKDGIEMDFPQITPTQQSREQVIRQFFERHGLHVRTTIGDNGGHFLDVDLPPDAMRVAEITNAAFTEIFGLRAPVTLQFLGDGLGVAA